MRRNQNSHEWLEIGKGFLLISVLHILAGLFIFFGLSHILMILFGSYTASTIWFSVVGRFFLWQLCYAFPLAIWLKRRSKLGMVKGVIIGVFLMVLLNIGLYIWLISLSP